MDELIVNKKGKTVRCSLRFITLSPHACWQRSTPIDVSTSAPPHASSSSSTAPPKRRRVPITIVDDDDHPPVITQPTSDNNILLNPISSRRVSQSPPSDGKSTPIAPSPAPASASSKPTPASFREAKQVREAKFAGHVGGGIFRMSGKDTVFKTRDVPAPTVADPPKDPTRHTLGFTKRMCTFSTPS